MKEPEKTYLPIYGILLVLMLCGCIEPFNATLEEFESVLVINATITNQLKQQQVHLSRTYQFGDEGPKGEQNAQVWVTSMDGTRFDFEEGEAGIYRSEEAFAAMSNTDYVLSVTTQDRKSYTSGAARLSGSTKLDTVFAERVTTDLGIDGIAIIASTSDTSDDSKYYRYEYEETYKIIVPEFSGRDLAINPSGGWLFPPRPPEQEICFNTDLSTRVILADTEDLNENRLDRFLVRFIDRDNYIISHRYSVLVRQFTQSLEAHSFYENLKDFSTQENIFSETQPGFLEGNILSLSSNKEKVLGYFDVASVDEHRIFFNYEDFFPGEPLPPYVEPCVYGAPDEDKLGNLVDINLIKFITENFPGSGATGTGPFITVPRVCGDCTVLGTPEVPDFWIE